MLRRSYSKHFPMRPPCLLDRLLGLLAVGKDVEAYGPPSLHGPEIRSLPLDRRGGSRRAGAHHDVDEHPPVVIEKLFGLELDFLEACEKLPVHPTCPFAAGRGA